MLKKFPQFPKSWALPISSRMKESFDQAKADLTACRQSSEPYFRRSTLVICPPSPLRLAIMIHAFRGAELYILDWKGRAITRADADTAILPELSKHDGSKPGTVCILDAELMDRQQLQSVVFCIEDAPPGVNFVFATSLPEQCLSLVQRTRLTIDCYEDSNEREYAASKVKLFGNFYKHESGFEPDRTTLSCFAEQIEISSPVAIAELACEVVYAQAELSVMADFNLTGDIFIPAFQMAQSRINLRRHTLLANNTSQAQ